MLERKYIYSITANVKYQTSIHIPHSYISNISTFDIYTDCSEPLSSLLCQYMSSYIIFQRTTNLLRCGISGWR